MKSKTYSLINVKDEEVIKAEGVNKKIKHKEFVDVLFKRKVIRHNMKIIKIKLHRIGTYDVSKSCFDDGVNSLAYFHKDIKNS